MVIFDARMSRKGVVWEIMDFTMMGGIRMMGKEKLITVWDRDVTVMNKIMATGVADTGIVPAARDFGPPLSWGYSSDMDLMN
jgi:hypothetical protein